ncbi:hypothetical protein GOP47_0029159 [Adiantum capillus-veneris]|nr:hypothetical protein GOP47_0029159 [Adiantum capillus-veneris]
MRADKCCTCYFRFFPRSFGGKLFSTDFTALSKEEQDARLPMIKVSKHFQCWEHVDGSLVNVAEGLELYENVLNTYEASQVASLITELQSSGRRGEFGGKTFVVEKRMNGSSKEVIQFGDNNKGSGELLDPMPLVFNSLIDRLILWHILPASKRPDYCSIEVLEEGEDCPPFLSYQHVDQYFCCLFLMAESTIVFGHKLPLDGGDHKSRFKLLLPSGSALVIQGNSAEAASRAVIPSPGKRIMVTFAKLLSGKVMDMLSSGGKIPSTHPAPPNSVLPSSAAAAWPPVGLPGGGSPGVHGLVPAMMKHIGMANASGVLPIPPPLRPFAHGPHPIPQHLVTAPGNVPVVVPGGPARTFPPMGVLSPAGWPAVPPRAPPRPPNLGTGVFFPSSGSGGSGNVGRPLQMQPGVVMMSPLLQKSEPLVPFAPIPVSELQSNRTQRPAGAIEQGDHLVERGDSLGSWHPSAGSGGEPILPRKATRKESAHPGLKPGVNGNSIVKEEQQQRGFHHRPNKAGGSKN